YVENVSAVVVAARGEHRELHRVRRHGVDVGGGAELAGEVAGAVGAGRTEEVADRIAGREHVVVQVHVEATGEVRRRVRNWMTIAWIGGSSSVGVVHPDLGPGVAADDLRAHEWITIGLTAGALRKRRACLRGLT